jgi:putative transcriptional regulator
VRYPDEEVALKALGARLKALRNDKGLTQAAVAAKLGSSVQRVQLAERGGANLRFTSLLAYANVLDVDLAEMVPKAGKKKD